MLQRACLGRPAQRHASEDFLCPRISSRASSRKTLQICSKARASQKSQQKQKIVQLSGSKNGLDRSVSQKQEIEGLIKQMEASQPRPKKANLLGTQWHLAYSTSPGSSGGKLGPFIGWVEQEFPSDKPGCYVNKLDLGLLKADLLAEYKYAANNKIDVKFVNITFSLGPFKITRPFSNSGFWDITYVDEDFRILYTNLGNVFVMEKIEQSKIKA